ncbi:hypothetical protein FALBO_1230 [Fusarium albosuccineum]|uniref:Uncharacterized protein n=1 Tax=Fusarium albosuccineum TaxID=1237068 RepID=A0A8H4PIL7_9HYPO|nr:hypothetical protein FALBO_1230 [Fusarium albosuccineum]
MSNAGPSQQDSQAALLTADEFTADQPTADGHEPTSRVFVTMHPSESGGGYLWSIAVREVRKGSHHLIGARQPHEGAPYELQEHDRLALGDDVKFVYFDIPYEKLGDTYERCRSTKIPKKAGKLEIGQQWVVDVCKVLTSKKIIAKSKEHQSKIDWVKTRRD